MSPLKAQKAAAAKLDQYHQQDKDSPEEDCGTAHEEKDSAGDTDRLLEAITFCQTSFTAQIEKVKVNISLIRQNLQKLRDRVKTAENHLGAVEDVILPLQTGVDRMQLQINQLLTKQDMENRLRRCNLRFIGLPEGAEGKDPTMFLERLLNTTHGCEAFSPTLAVEKAHRMPARPPPQGAPPRTFITKLLNYKNQGCCPAPVQGEGQYSIWEW